MDRQRASSASLDCGRHADCGELTELPGAREQSTDSAARASARLASTRIAALAGSVLMLICSCSAETPNAARLQFSRPTAWLDGPSPPQAAPATAESDTSRHASFSALQVPGFRPALLFTPAGSEIQPLLVAAHGAGGSPQWECEYWRQLTRERAFLLCLSGTPLGSYEGFYFRDHRKLESEFLAAERAARAAEPRIAPGSGVYAGFSQGATMGSAMIEKYGRAFPYLVLIEGFDPWDVPRARRYGRAGGKRVLIACGSRECAKIGKTSAHWLEVSGVQARFEFAPGAGHTPGGVVMTRVQGSLSWLLAGERLWRPAVD